VKYICMQCRVEEEIPLGVVRDMDFMDGGETMDHLQAIQRFADEIERRLEEPFDIDEAIRLAYVSKFHR
jgi:hypothetical protein